MASIMQRGDSELVRVAVHVDHVVEGDANGHVLTLVIVRKVSRVLRERARPACHLGHDELLHLERCNKQM